LSKSYPKVLKNLWAVRRSRSGGIGPENCSTRMGNNGIGPKARPEPSQLLSRWRGKITELKRHYRSGARSEKRFTPTQLYMHASLTKISEELLRQAKRCETIAQDKTQESLTGAPAEKELNEQAAKDWLLKSGVWLEAEKVVRELVLSSDPDEPIHPKPSEEGSRTGY